MKIDRYWPYYLTFTIGTSLLGLILTIVMGLNWGIDFTGGALLERGFDHTVTVSEVEAVLASDPLKDLDLAKSVVQPIQEPGAKDQSIVMIRTKALDNDQMGRVDDALKAKFGSLDIRQSQSVGPVIGRELVRNAVWAMVLAAVLILGYITYRYEYRFAFGVIASMLHDVFLVLGALAVTQTQINSPFVAAILTVAGYSINDTVVVFDRIRENLRFRKRESVEEIATTGVQQTLARSINTSVTTLLALVALAVFGGESLRDFTLTLLVGVLTGTYSSIFLASPMWMLWRRHDEKRGVRTATT